MTLSTLNGASPNLKGVPTPINGALRVLAGALFAASLLTGGNNAAAQVTCDGQWVAAFGPQGLNGQVASLALMPNGDLAAGGSFTLAGGVAANRVARWNGTSWLPLGAGIDGDYIASMAVDIRGDLFVTGEFAIAGGVSANNIARWNGAEWSTLGTGIGNVPSFFDYGATLLPLANGDVIAGGYFLLAGGNPVSYVARWNGEVWAGVGSGINSSVSDLAVTPIGDLIAVGQFYRAGGGPGTTIARWNGSSWSSIGSGLGRETFNGNPEGGAVAVTVLPNGDIVAGGSFREAGAVPVNRIARWNGAEWLPLGEGIGGTNPVGGASVMCLAVLPNGDLVAGGYFNTAGGTPARNIARWNGAVWSPLGSGVVGGVHSLAPLPNGDLVVGGNFSSAGGVPVSNIAVYRFVDNATPSITTQPASVSVCRTASAALSLSANAGLPPAYRWRKAGVPIDIVTNPSAATDTLRLVRVQASDAGLYDCIVSTDCGTVTSAAARLTVRTCICLEADIVGGGAAGNEPDGTVDGTDFIAFINSFAIGDATVDPLADIAGGGDTGLEPDGTIDGTDFIFFINAFAIGC
jgi:hypothetical protein